MSKGKEHLTYSDVMKIVYSDHPQEWNPSLAIRGREVERTIREAVIKRQGPEGIENLRLLGGVFNRKLVGEEAGVTISSTPDIVMVDPYEELKGHVIEVKMRSNPTSGDLIQGLFGIYAAQKDPFLGRRGLKSRHFFYYNGSKTVTEIPQEAGEELRGDFDNLCLAASGLLGLNRKGEAGQFGFWQEQGWRRGLNTNPVELRIVFDKSYGTIVRRAGNIFDADRQGREER